MLRFGVVWCACVLRWLCVRVHMWCVVLVLCVYMWCCVLCGLCLCVRVVWWCVWCVVKLGTRKTPLCVRSKRLRVYGQDVSVCTALPSSSPLPPPFSPSPPPQKKVGTFQFQEYFRRGIYFYFSYKLIPKNRHRVKLQALQF